VKLSLEVRGIVLGAVSSLAAVGLALAAGQGFWPSAFFLGDATATALVPAAGSKVRLGYELFQLNCAHCHGNNARGGEGPDLHGIAKSDARVASVIKNGIQGEMPKFGAKLSEKDVQALVAFVRSLHGNQN
jgi:mono/diheme cytochrome c family protein